jgi:uncharacterized protein (DUF305 family)
MKNNLIVIAGGTLIIGSLLGYSVASHQDSYATKTNWENRSAAGMHRMPDGSMMHNMPTNAGMGHLMGMSVTSEKEFITEMIPHHQEAVDTAKIVLERGATTPEIKVLVENIITAQEKEIADMKEWYRTWYGGEYTPNGRYEPMMRDISTLSGVALDKAFLGDMIGHHMGALMMAHSVSPYITHSEIETLTNNIISSQSAEIVQMKQLLKTI